MAQGPPGPRDSRLEQPVVVHPGNMGGAGDEALNSWRHDTRAGQPARDRRYVAVIL